jgi:glucokinase
MAVRIGIDIGGTKVAAALLDDAGEVVDQSWSEHHARGNSAVSVELATAAEGLSGEASIDAVGVSVSGLVRRNGTVTGGASLEISGDLAGEIAECLGRPVHVFNDAEATLRSVVAGHRAQTGDDVRDAVLLTIGTGIGGAIVSNGRPVRGRTGLATELGHLPVRPATADACVCGSSGCLEQYAGGKGIADRARMILDAGGGTERLRRLHHATAGITTKDIVAAAGAGDDVALTLLDEAAESCARAIHALCVTIEPDIVFLGGTVAHGASDILPARIRAHLAASWPFTGLTVPPPVQLDVIGPFAAAIGAGLLTRDLARSDDERLSLDIPLEDNEND